MTLDEKIGQLFMTNIPGDWLYEDGIRYIQALQPGAIAIFPSNTTGKDAASLARFINTLQENTIDSGAGIPLIIATDQEGGNVQRVQIDVTQLPDPLGFGASGNLDSVRDVAQHIGAELHDLGITMNLAPSVDLSIRADMLSSVRVMNRRTSGDDPERVGILAAAYVDGLADAGVIGVIKHFPGHGGAADSHAQLPRIDTDRETAFATSLHSFEMAIQEGVPAVMVGHLYYSDIEPTPNLPASLSPTMIGILRDDFDFSGVVMSDAFDMSAIYDNFYADDAALMFIRAGGDMLVSGPFLPWNMQLNIKAALIAAVEDGTLSESRIDESVRRILELKAAYGLLEWEPIDTESLHIDLDATQNALIEVYMDAATLLRDNNHLLPLAPDDDVAFVYPKIFPDILTTCNDLAPDAAFHGYLLHVADWEFEVVRLLGIHYLVWVPAALVLVLSWILANTPYGRSVYATGGNREAAYFSGINVNRVVTSTYVWSGALAGLAGVMLASRLQSGQPTAGEFYELTAIAAVVLGGAALHGGEGKLYKTVIGVFIMVVLGNGLNLMNVDSYWQRVAVGAVIILAAAADRLKKGN